MPHPEPPDPSEPRDRFGPPWEPARQSPQSPPHYDQHYDQHPENELILVALGEPAPAAVTAHLAGCAECRAQVEQLRGVVAEARSLGDAGDDATVGVDVTDGADVRPVPPEDRVWTAIAEATGVSVQARPERVRAAAGSLAPELVHPETDWDWERAGARAASSGPIPIGPIKPASPARLPAARPARRRNALLAYVAAACLLLGLGAGAGGVLAVQRLGEKPAGPSPAVLSQATLAALPAAPSAAGRADVVQTGGGRQLTVTVRRLAAPDGFYEVWLSDPKLRTMLPVGVMQGDVGRFDLPAGIDPGSFPTVDISLEPVDGNPAHSARSVLRGTLQS